MRVNKPTETSTGAELAVDLLVVFGLVKASCAPEGAPAVIHRDRREPARHEVCLAMCRPSPKAVRGAA